MASDATVRSPDGKMTVTLRVSGEGRPEYSILRNGRTVIDWSRLGFILADAPKLERNFELARVEEKSFDETWEQPWGERRFVRNRCNEQRVDASREDRAAPRHHRGVSRVRRWRGFSLRVPRAAVAGAGGNRRGAHRVRVAEPATAWWIPGGEWNRYEYLYNKTPLTELGQAHTPMTLKTASGLHIAIHEAALVDYAGMWLRRVSGQRLKAVLSPSSSGPPVSRKAPFATPWRTLQIADSAPGLYMSDLILNLNEPNKLGDVSWVKPFKYVGIWWGMHLGTQTWASGPETRRDHGRNEALHRLRGETMVSAACWWRAGTRAGTATGLRTAMTSVSPRPIRTSTSSALAAYAKKKGVRLVGHHETAGNIAVYEKQLGAGARSVREARHRRGEDRLRGRCRWRAGAGRRWPHSFRMA